MAEFDIEISGIDEVCGRLTIAPSRIAKHGFARALAAASAPVVLSVAANTPTDTGDLVKHLMADIEIDSEGKGGYAQIGFGREGWKARLVETGHRMVGHEPFKQERGHVAAQPFMGPAAAESAERSVAAFSETLSDSLREDLLTRAS